MKTRFAMMFLMACAIASGATTRVLFIGSSYIYWNDLPGTLKNLAASLGETTVTQQNTPGGYTLAQHSTNATTLSLIDQGGWDYVVLQEHSGVQLGTPDEVAARTYPYAKILSDRISAGNPGAKILFYMHWAYENSGNLAAFDAGQQRL
jgi:hypothetical protein